jgi:cytochrome c553
MTVTHVTLTSLRHGGNVSAMTTIRMSIREHDIADLRAYLARHDAAVNSMGWAPGPEAQDKARRIRAELARRARAVQS